MSDTLERELVIVASQLSKAAISLRFVANLLKGERERASVSASDMHSPVREGPEPAPIEEWPPQEALPFPEDPFA